MPARVIPLDIRLSGTNPFEELKLLWTYYRLMRAENPAAYLGWKIKPNLYGALAARAAGVPCILNVSGLGTAFLVGRFFGRFVSLLYKLAFRKASIVFFKTLTTATFSSRIAWLPQTRRVFFLVQGLT